RRIRVRKVLDQFLGDGTNAVRRDHVIRELDPAPPVGIAGLWVVDRVLRRYRAEIAALHGRRGQPHHDGGTIARSKALVIGEEEQLVLANRTANAATELVPPPGRDIAGRLRVRVPGE